MATIADFNPYQQLEAREGLVKVSREELTRLHSEESRLVPWYLSEKLYFFFAGSCLYLGIEFTASTLGVFEFQFKGFLYTFYALLFCNLANLPYPLVLYLMRKMHYKLQVRLSFLISYVCVLWIAGAGLFFPGSRWAFYSILLAQMVSMVFCYAGQNFVTKTLDFYDHSCIPYYYSPVCLWIVLMSLVAIPMSHYKIDPAIQILVPLAFVSFIFFYAYILHNSISATDYYQEKQRISAQIDEHITYEDVKTDLSNIFWYFLMLISCVTAAATIFPSMIAEFRPKGITHMTWVNIISALGNTIYSLSTFLSFHLLNSDWVQHTIIAAGLCFSLLVAAVFCKLIDGDSDGSDLWVEFFIGCMFLKFELGYYLTYSMGKAFSLTKSKAGVYLINGAINAGYLFGCLLAVWTAEVRKAN